MQTLVSYNFTPNDFFRKVDINMNEIKDAFKTIQ